MSALYQFIYRYRCQVILGEPRVIATGSTQQQ